MIVDIITDEDNHKLSNCVKNMFIEAIIDDQSQIPSHSGLTAGRYMVCLTKPYILARLHQSPLNLVTDTRTSI